MQTCWDHTPPDSVIGGCEWLQGPSCSDGRAAGAAPAPAALDSSPLLLLEGCIPLFLP